MATKFNLNYRVVEGKHPVTKAQVLRPQICDRETYYSEQVIRTGLERGYIRGQYEDSLGTFRGALECVKQLGKEGKAVNLGFFRVHVELTGQVGESRQLTDANELHVAITALQDLKANVSDFSWTNVDDSTSLPKIDTLMSVGGMKSGELVKNKEIVVTGRNLGFSSSFGDTAVFSLKEGTTDKTLAVTPSESDYSHQKYAFSEGLADVEAGTILILTLTLHGDIEGGAVKTATKSATLKAAA